MGTRTTVSGIGGPLGSAVRGGGGVGVDGPEGVEGDAGVVVEATGLATVENGGSGTAPISCGLPLTTRTMLVTRRLSAAVMITGSTHADRRRRPTI
jgi:hypothetical protein